MLAALWNLLTLHEWTILFLSLLGGIVIAIVCFPLGVWASVLGNRFSPNKVTIELQTNILLETAKMKLSSTPVAYYDEVFGALTESRSTLLKLIQQLVLGTDHQRETAAKLLVAEMNRFSQGAQGLLFLLILHAFENRELVIVDTANADIAHYDRVIVNAIASYLGAGDREPLLQVGKRLQFESMQGGFSSLPLAEKVRFFNRLVPDWKITYKQLPSGSEIMEVELTGPTAQIGLTATTPESAAKLQQLYEYGAPIELAPGTYEIDSVVHKFFNIGSDGVLTLKSNLQDTPELRFRLVARRDSATQEYVLFGKAIEAGALGIKVHFWTTFGFEWDLTLPKVGGARSFQVKIVTNIGQWPMNADGKALAQFLMLTMQEGVDVEFYCNSEEGEFRLTRATTNKGDSQFAALMQLFAAFVDVSNYFDVQFQLPEVVPVEDANAAVELAAFVNGIPLGIPEGQISAMLTPFARNEFLNNWEEASAPRPFQSQIPAEEITVLGLSLQIPTRSIIVENIVPRFSRDDLTSMEGQQDAELWFDVVAPNTLTRQFSPPD